MINVEMATAQVQWVQKDLTYLSTLTHGQKKNVQMINVMDCQQDGILWGKRAVQSSCDAISIFQAQ